jgi:hypothetical protein
VIHAPPPKADKENALPRRRHGLDKAVARLGESSELTALAVRKLLGLEKDSEFFRAKSARNTTVLFRSMRLILPHVEFRDVHRELHGVMLAARDVPQTS